MFIMIPGILIPGDFCLLCLYLQVKKGVEFNPRNASLLDPPPGDAFAVRIPGVLAIDMNRLSDV